jgi:hypothetical protein
LLPPPTRHTDEQLPVGKLACRETSATKQSRPWRQASARDTSHARESKVSDLQRDCHHEHRSVAQFVQERKPAENIVRPASTSEQGTFTSSTRPTVTNKRVLAARPWTSKTKARHSTNFRASIFSSPGSANGVVDGATPTKVTQDKDCDSSSDYADRDDLDDGDRVVLDHIDDRDLRARCRLVLGKRKAVDASPRNYFDHRGLMQVTASAKDKVKQHAKVCTVGDCTSLVRSRGVCTTHGGGKRCRYPEGCGTSAEGRTMFCVAHGGGKRCQYPEGCGKSARGSTLFCAVHGGGKRSQYPEGCDKGAEGRTMFCIAHGGGKRCQYPDGCDKSAQGATSFCKAHGGGKRCQYPDGCDKSAQGATSFCKAHGGGKRCQYPDGCDKGARGSTLFCKAHGGGKRCEYPDGCGKAAEGRTSFCVAHGGGKRCQYPDGCDKSTQGATSFCIAHGGGKRCQYPDGCDNGADGRTMFCIAHGGGKRCQYPNGCGKSAQGATLFCRAHGGGKRCIHNSGCNKHVVKRGMCKQHGVAAGLWA